MMNQTNAIEFLKKFRHGHRTDLKKGTLNNRDACAYLIWKAGPSKVRDLVEALRAWRSDEPPTFNYLFNTSTHGGYGCVGKDAMSRGQEMVCWQYLSNGEGRDSSWFRRHYWFRASKGTYAPTLECARRMSELGFS